MTTLLRWLFITYVIVATVALVGGVVGVYGLLGFLATPYAVLPAMAVGLPWSLLIMFSVDARPGLNFFVLGCMLLTNALLLRWLAQRVKRRASVSRLRASFDPLDHRTHP